MNLLVTPEDFRLDQFILKPIFSRLFNGTGGPRARVRVYQEPNLGGVGEV